LTSPSFIGRFGIGSGFNHDWSIFMATGSSVLGIVAQAWPYLYEGKGQRICDIKLYLSDYPQEEIKGALEDAVTLGQLTRYEQGGESFYLKKVGE
jgi:hypothetical protein